MGRAMGVIGWCAGVSAAAAFSLAASAADEPPPMLWAYPHAAQKHTPDRFRRKPIYSVPGSPLRRTEAQAMGEFTPLDWFPDEHPAMPDIVAHGRKPDVLPCGLCHQTAGLGVHGAPALAGLPKAYILEQLNAFRDGRRGPALPMRDAEEMHAIAAAITPSQANAAADYFSRLPIRRRIRVVETATVPASGANYWGWTNVLPGDRTEPVGRRIVEVDEDPQRGFLSDPHSGFVAYVAPGAVARGQAIAEHGAGGQQACTVCHGPRLQGTPLAPPLAGRSPTYLARQLWDIRSGTRNGPGVTPMKAVAAQLDPAAIVEVTAYAASLAP